MTDKLNKSGEYRLKKYMALLLSTLFFLSGCSVMTVQDKESKRSELDAMAEKTIMELKAKKPDLQNKLNISLAYAVADMSVTKVPLIGGGGGEGVLFIKKTKQRIYFTVGRFDFGAGIAARSYQVLMVFNTQKVVDEWKDGNWEYSGGVEVSSGLEAREDTTNNEKQGFSLHILEEGGGGELATITARVVRVKVIRELTDNP